MYKFILSQHYALPLCCSLGSTEKKSIENCNIFVSYKIYEYNKDALCGKDIKDLTKIWFFETRSTQWIFTKTILFKCSLSFRIWMDLETFALQSANRTVLSHSVRSNLFKLSMQQVVNKKFIYIFPLSVRIFWQTSHISVKKNPLRLALCILYLVLLQSGRKNGERTDVTIWAGYANHKQRIFPLNLLYKYPCNSSSIEIVYQNAVKFSEVFAFLP